MPRSVLLRKGDWPRARRSFPGRGAPRWRPRPPGLPRDHERVGEGRECRAILEQRARDGAPASGVVRRRDRVVSGPNPANKARLAWQNLSNDSLLDPLCCSPWPRCSPGELWRRLRGPADPERCLVPDERYAVRHDLRGPVYRRGELRQLRHDLPSFDDLHFRQLRLPDGTHRLPGGLRRSAERPQPMWRVRHGLPVGSGLLGGRLQGGL
jgi:hypothetical protein